MIRGMVAAACSRHAPAGGGSGAPPGLYTFEDGTIPSAISGAGSSGWYVVNETSVYLAKALRSPTIGNSQFTQFSFSIETTSATNNFKVRYLVSSESGYDFFYVIIDGVEKIKASGNSGMHVNYTTSLSAGVHQVLVKYAKDSSAAAGNDAVFIPLFEWA